MAKSYPEVYYSERIKNVLNGTPSFRPQPQYPSRPENEGSCFTAILLYGGGLCALIGIVNAISGGEGAGYMIVGGIIAFVLSLVITNVAKESNEKKFQNSSAMAQYRSDLSRWESERAATLTKDKLQKHRKEEYSRLPAFKYDTAVLSDRDGRPTEVQLGASELFFQQKLQQSELFQMHGPMHLNHYYHTYYPDIVVNSLDRRILFDIEIDEPYAFGTNEAIHFVNENGISIDNERNEAFTKHGFCVIRFSEEQVVKRPNDCIIFISSIIDSISNGIDIIPPTSCSLTQRKWTRQDAEWMARNNYRNTYLPEYLRTESNSTIHFDVQNEPPTTRSIDSDNLPF